MNSLAKHCSLFKNIHLIANNPLKLDNVKKACLINLNIILYYVLPLNNCEYP